MKNYQNESYSNAWANLHPLCFIYLQILTNDIILMRKCADAFHPNKIYAGKLKIIGIQNQFSFRKY